MNRTMLLEAVREDDVSRRGAGGWVCLVDGKKVMVQQPAPPRTLHLARLLHMMQGPA